MTFYRWKLIENETRIHTCISIDIDHSRRVVGLLWGNGRVYAAPRSRAGAP